MNGFSRKTLVAVSLSLMGTGSAVADHAWPVTPSWGWAGYARAGDFDGDGFFFDIVSPNLVSAVTTHMYMKRGTITGLESLQQSSVAILPDIHVWGSGNYVFAGDFNGDGYDDLASANGGVAYMKYGSASLDSEGARWGTVTVSINPSWGGADFTFAGDFNGDGKDDIASAYNGSVYMKFGTALGNFTSATWTVSNQWGNGAYSFSGDFNGDGLDDIASITSGTAYMKLSTGSGFTSTTWSISNLWGAGGYTFAGDFNGDGFDDIASANGSTVYMKLSNGSGFYNPGNEFVNPTWGGAEWTFVGDFTGDGVDDIASASDGWVYVKVLND